MLINIIILSLFLSVLLIYGNFFTKIYSNNFNIIETHFLSFRLIFGLFFLGSITFVFNFFYAVYTFNFLIVLIIFLVISLFFYYRDKKDIKKKNLINLYIIIFSSVFFIFYANQLPPGYDGGLYHIPHQVIIREDKISFGLANIHSRYGLSTFYNYISSLLWFENNFTGVALLQSVYLIIFFIFLFELIQHNNKLITICVLSILLTMPVWFRYNIPGFSLVDLSYGVFFFIAIILSTLILLNKYEFNQNKYFITLLIVCSLCFMHKSNGAQLLPLVLFVIFMKVKKNELKITDLIKILIIPSIILTLWLIRTTIISGCAVFPIEISCFNFWWVTEHEAKITLNVISSWAKRGFSVLEISPNILYSIIILFFLLIYLFKKNLIKSISFNEDNNFKKISLIILFIFLVLIYTQSHDLRGFSSIVTSGDQFLFKKIILKEFLLLTLVNLLSIIFVLIFTNFFNNFDSTINKNILPKIPSIFVFVYLILWFYLAPNPRFAIGAFALIAPCFLIIFFCNFENMSNKKLNLFTNSLLIIFIFKFTIFDAYLSNSLRYIKKEIPEPKVIKREMYGFKPIDISKDNRCWKIKYCYSDSHDVKFKYTFLNYKVFYKVDNE